MKIGLIVNPKKPLAKKIIAELIEFLIKNKIAPLIEESAAEILKHTRYSATEKVIVGSSNLIVALGGDGTMLRAARLVGNKGIPIMGVNLGGLGYLTMFAADQVKTAVADFLNKNCREEERMVLVVSYKKEKFFALNDCAINMGPDYRVIELILSADNSFICKLVADGVVIATPTGSTAYSLAAGGPIVFSTMEAILITPLSPHVLSARPLVVPVSENLTLELGPRTKQAILTIDGQQRRVIKRGEKVLITKADFLIRLIAPKDKSYYEILRSKMKWSERGE
jgi:NAD+ kinase